jgi:cytochrome b6-f complex iron-sulfur subunit
VCAEFINLYELLVPGYSMTQNVEQIPVGRRQFLTFLTGGAITGVTLAALYPVISFFTPPAGAGGGKGVAAKDALGKEIKASALLASAAPGAHIISQGLSIKGGDATYIVVTEAKKIAEYGVNAVCTHLGCVVPYDAGAGKFVCPCHGSQYASDGGLLKGPAPQPLALAKAAVKDDKIVFSPWEGNDFRSTPLWNQKKPYWL